MAARRSLLAALFALPFALLLAACGRDTGPTPPGGGEGGTSGGTSGGTLVYGRGKDSPGLDPAAETDGESALVISNVYDTLVAYEYGSGTELKPALATSWEWGNDHRTLSMNLREGVKFHDGTPLDAKAVVANLERQRDPAHPFNFTKAPYSYWASMFGSVSRVSESGGPLSVRFEFSEPAPPFFLHLLAMFSASIVSPAALEKGGAFVARHAVGTGAFRMVEWRAQEITLEANADWWGGRPKIDRLVFVVIPDVNTMGASLQSGKVDGIDNVAPRDVPRVKADPALLLHQVPGMNVCYLALNNDAAPFTDVRVRRAVALAIDRAKIVDAAYEGQAIPATSMVPPTVDGSIAVREGTREEDPSGAVAKAKALLEAAGAKGARVVLSYPSNPRPYMPDSGALAIQVADDLRGIGLEVELKKEEWNPYLDRLSNGEHQMGLIGWSADVNDADNFLYVLLDKESAVKGSANNYAFYRSEAFHEKVLAARRSHDRAERNRLYAEAQRIVAADTPVVPLVHTPVRVATSAKVGNFRVDPVNSRRFAWVTLAR